ncbi:hypothetical protein NPIL_453271 [Nephila pilipes]|uniref:Uncharacterized protein n=1 Tax=Nephila pilipes TaxID=299642 RepID=A0A8X6MQM4_NEPPI|nr:hypothetical protein NPIL_453271 [Nephila pilipes]
MLADNWKLANCRNRSVVLSSRCDGKTTAGRADVNVANTCADKASRKADLCQRLHQWVNKPSLMFWRAVVVIGKLRR